MLMLNVPTPETDVPSQDDLPQSPRLGRCLSRRSHSPDVSHDEAPSRQRERRTSTFGSLYEETFEVLGSGVTGDVTLAVNRRTGNKVAVKTFHTIGMSTEKIRDLAREVQMQASLQHPRVGRLEGICESDEYVRLLFEHLEGGEVIQHLLDEGSFSESHASRVVGQLLSAVEHMHAQGLVHRDIKPDNLVYTDSDKESVKLIDFGFCTRWTDGDDPMTRRCGTYGYMAPEVLREVGYTRAVDMWSVGVVAHVLLTGDMLGRNRDWTPVYSKQLTGRSLGAQKFLAALLTVDPAARMTARQALGHSWLSGQGQNFQDPFSRGCSASDDCAGNDLDHIDSAEALRDFFDEFSCPSVKTWRERVHDFSSLYLSSAESEASKQEKKSIWQCTLDSPKLAKKPAWQSLAAEPSSPKVAKSAQKQTWQPLSARIRSSRVSAVSAVLSAVRPGRG